MCGLVYHWNLKAVKKFSSLPHYSTRLRPLLPVQSPSSPADWQEVSIRAFPGCPRRELLSTSYMDSLNTEGRAVACRGHEESLNQELTNSTADVAAMVQGS